MVLGALTQAAPDRLPAAGAGQACIVMLALTDWQTGKRRVGVIQPICGGSGARPHRDGIDGMDFAFGFLRNIPAETLETEMPILVERYALRPDSAGAGKYRGGVGMELKVRVFAPDTVLTARNSERLRFNPWGRLGGRPAVLGTAIFNEGEPGERVVGRIEELLMQPGDTAAFLTQGGGGYGSPLERDPEAVAWDVRRELISREAAARDYGVKLNPDGTVDPDGTAIARQGLAGRPADSAAFAFGPEREAYERVWSDEMQLALNQLLTAYPPNLRTSIKNAVAARVDEWARERPVAPADLQAALGELLARSCARLVCPPNAAEPQQVDVCPSPRLLQQSPNPSTTSPVPIHLSPIPIRLLPVLTKAGQSVANPMINLTGPIPTFSGLNIELI